MSDAVWTTDIKRHSASIEAGYQAFLDDPETPDEFDRGILHKRGENMVVLVIEYTETE